MDRPSERRVLHGIGVPNLIEVLARLPGSDLTTLLMAVMRERSKAVRPPDVLRSYGGGRFVVPARVSFEALRRTEDAFLSVLDDAWDRVELAPLVPFGTHAVLGDISQDRVVSTIRGNEAAADPTIGLALEVAARRRSSRKDLTRLATVQRIVRAQRFEDAPSHFTIFGLATGGRDAGQGMWGSWGGGRCGFVSFDRAGFPGRIYTPPVISFDTDFLDLVLSGRIFRL